VIFATLVIQAPTLRPLARVLNLHSDGSAADEEAHARLASAEAGLRVLDAIDDKGIRYPEVARYLRQRHRQRARRWAAAEATRFENRILDHGHVVSMPPSHQAGALDEKRAAEYRQIRSSMIAAEQQALLDLRDDGTIGDDVMTSINRELDLEQILLDSAQPVVESAREVQPSPSAPMS